MPKGNLIALALALLGVAVLAGYYVMTRPVPPPVVPPEPEASQPATEGTAPGDEPGPYLTITVAGEANGQIRIDLFEQTAPLHAAHLTALAEAGSYDGVVFHRVIDGFMAQTGDVQFGRIGGDMRRAGSGGSDRPNLVAEFSDIPFERGIVGMARAQDPDSANSQFFIMFDAGPFLNGQYTVVGKVTEGMDVVDAIKRGTWQNGAVIGEPDVMEKVMVTD